MGVDALRLRHLRVELLVLPLRQSVVVCQRELVVDEGAVLLPEDVVEDRLVLLGRERAGRVDDVAAVYSTCTFAPEENEAVLDHALQKEDCSLVDYDLPLAHDDGLREWQDQEFDPQVTKAKRVYPHQNDTGGFFTAKLEVGT